ncbi:MAG: L-threonylcarbamoyladenylate synthase [Bacteroidia bacterium]
MIISINPDNPQERMISQVIDILRDGGVIIYPTDTMYGLGCDINNRKAVNRICKIKGIDPEKSLLTCVCEDISIIGTYANHVTTPIYKLMRQALPGPYTFVLQASREIPRHFQARKTVGIRVPNHRIPQQLASLLGNPIASISLPPHEEYSEFVTDPSLIHDQYENLVDVVIDGGYGGLVPSTVIDCSQGENAITIIRTGAGPLEPLGLILEEN